MLVSGVTKFFSLFHSKKVFFLDFFFSSLVYTSIAAVFVMFAFYLLFSFKKPEASQAENDFFILSFKYLLKVFFFLILVLSIFCLFFTFDFMFSSRNLLYPNEYFKDSGDFFFYKNGVFQFSLNLYGLILVFLCLITGFVAISTVNNLYFEEKLKFYLIFFQFLLAILGFIKSSDLITFFFFYEVLMLGSFLIVYYGSYSKKAVQASLYFVLWTQLGSLLVLLACLYTYSLTNSTSFFAIKAFVFSKSEALTIYALLFFGFGVKFPIWPFHYWLTKTHVEASSGFSIYLSGFLVKTALFGFYRLTNLMQVELITSFFLVILIVGVFDSSLKMWGQTDLKKLVAYCTIQEMNLISIFFLKGDSNIVVYGFLFNIMHAFLSTLMFFLVECVYSRYKSRSILAVNGIFFSFNNLALSIIFMIFFFSGIPGTLKFVCEFFVFNLVFNVSWTLGALFVVVVNAFGLIGFSKNWFNAVFCAPNRGLDLQALDLSKKELFIILLCFFSLTFLTYVPILII